MAVFLRKLFRIGKLPGELRAQIEAEGIIHLTEYVPVTRRFTGAVPGLRSAGSIASYVGSLVLTNQRALATLSSVPKLAGRTIDQPWNAPQSGAVKAEISATGLSWKSTLPKSIHAAVDICRCITRTPFPRKS